MEAIFLACMVISYFLTKGKVDSTAYANGKEPPGVAKARMRHEAGGGGRTASGRPTGKGAFRLMAASRWANACLATKQRADHKAARRRAWYAETAPLKDAEWRAKQLRKLDKGDGIRAKWAQEHGLLDLSEYRERKAEDQAWKENERRNAEADETAGPDEADTLTDEQRQLVARIKDAWSQGKLTYPDIGYDQWYGLPVGVRADLLKAAQEGGLEIRSTFDPDARERAGLPVDRSATEGQRRPPAARKKPPADAEQAGTDQARAAEDPAPTESAPAGDTEDTSTGDTAAATPPEAPASSTATPSSTGGTVYEQGAAELLNSAEEIEGYKHALGGLGRDLEALKWGEEVHGPLNDMHTGLASVATIYRDLAELIKNQGDQVNDAYDEAPWVPGPEAVLS